MRLTPPFNSSGEITQKVHELLLKYPVKTFAKGEVILREGQRVENFYFLETGAIRMSATSESGKVVSLHFLYEGSVFPLLSIANDDLNDYELRAVTDLQTRVVPALVFKEWLMTDPEICYYFLVRVEGGLIKILSRLEGALATSALRQLASVLLYFAFHQPETAGEIELSVTHQELADWLGLTRENVTVQMRKLSGLGIVRSKHGKLCILDRQKLASLAQVESVADEL